MAIEFTITTDGWTYSLFEDNEKSRISIERDETEVIGIEREHALYEPVKNLMLACESRTARKQSHS